MEPRKSPAKYIAQIFTYEKLHVSTARTTVPIVMAGLIAKAETWALLRAT